MKDSFDRVRERARQIVEFPKWTKQGCEVRTTRYTDADGKTVLEDVVLSCA